MSLLASFTQMRCTPFGVASSLPSRPRPVETSDEKTGWSPTYAAFRIGWELGEGEIWFDDVALGHSPIACQ
jgi:hypothetical protein